MLSPDETSTTNALLSELVNIQRGNHPPSPSAADTSLPFTPSLQAQWLNCLWFASLALSLSSALISMLAKQWIQAYSPQTWGSLRDRARSRQRAYQALKTWYVGVIVDGMPMILHASVLLFFAGLVILLWPLQLLIAAVTVAIIASVSLFYCVTLLLPLWFTDCPYHNPVAQHAHEGLSNLTSTLSSIRRRWEMLCRKTHLSRLSIPLAMDPSPAEPFEKFSDDITTTKADITDVHIIRWLLTRSTEKSSLRTAAQAIAGLPVTFSADFFKPLKGVGALDHIGRGFQDLRIRLRGSDEYNTTWQSSDFVAAEAYCRAWMNMTWLTPEPGRLLAKWGGIGKILATMQTHGSDDTKVVAECAYAQLWHTNWTGLSTILAQLVVGSLKIDADTQCLLLTSLVRYADFATPESDGSSNFDIRSAAAETLPSLLHVLSSAEDNAHASQIRSQAAHAICRFTFHETEKSPRPRLPLEVQDGNLLVSSLLQLARSPERFGVDDGRLLSIIINELRVLAYDVGMARLHLRHDTVTSIEKTFFDLFSAGRLTSCDDRVLFPLLRLLWHGYSIDSPATAHLYPDQVVKSLLDLLQAGVETSDNENDKSSLSLSLKSTGHSRSVTALSIRCLEMILVKHLCQDVARAFWSADGIGAIVDVVREYNIPKSLSSYVELSALCRYLQYVADSGHGEYDPDPAQLDYIFRSQIFEMLCTEVRPGELWIHYRTRECYDALSALVDLRPNEAVWTPLHDKLCKLEKLDESLLALIAKLELR